MVIVNESDSETDVVHLAPSTPTGPFSYTPPCSLRDTHTRNGLILNEETSLYALVGAGFRFGYDYQS